MTYQQLPPLTTDERAALKADIKQRGVLVPVEVDENGNILDGYHRAAIADELGLKYPITQRFGWSEEQKREHALKLNILRRQMGPVSWGEAFQKLLEVRGVQTGPGARNDRRTSATVAEVAEELGVPERTAYYRVQVAKELAEHPDLRQAADSGEMSVKEAVSEKKKRERTTQRVQRESDRAAEPVPELPVRLEVADATDLPLQDNSVSLIVTSPPYGLDKSYRGVSDPGDGWYEFTLDWLLEAYRVAQPGGRLAVNVPLDTSEPYPRPTYSQAVHAACEAGWCYRWTIVWNEGNVSRSVARGSVDSPSAPHVIAPVEMIAVFHKGDWATPHRSEAVTDLTHEEWLEWTNGLWTFPGESRPWEGHPAAFPPELPRRLIKLLSYRWDLVLDPFCGSGTTPLEAHRLGRRAIAFDLSPEYVASSQRRIAQEVARAAAHD